MLIALLVATYANADGTNAHPGEDRLAKEIGLTTRSVRSHLAALREYGLLERTFHGSAGGRKRLADEYVLAVPPDVLNRIKAVEDRKKTSDGDLPITGSHASEHRKPSTDHRKSTVVNTGSPYPPTSTCTKDVDHSSPNSTHPSTSSTDRAPDATCGICGSTKFTFDDRCVTCGQVRPRARWVEPWTIEGAS